MIAMRGANLSMAAWSTARPAVTLIWLKAMPPAETVFFGRNEEKEMAPQRTQVSVRFEPVRFAHRSAADD